MSGATTADLERMFGFSSWGSGDSLKNMLAKAAERGEDISGALRELAKASAGQTRALEMLAQAQERQAKALEAIASAQRESAEQTKKNGELLAMALGFGNAELPGEESDPNGVGEKIRSRRAIGPAR